MGATTRCTSKSGWIVHEAAATLVQRKNLAIAANKLGIAVAHLGRRVKDGFLPAAAAPNPTPVVQLDGDGDPLAGGHSTTGGATNSSTQARRTSNTPTPSPNKVEHKDTSRRRGACKTNQAVDTLYGPNQARPGSPRHDRHSAPQTVRLATKAHSPPLPRRHGAAGENPRAGGRLTK